MGGIVAIPKYRRMEPQEFAAWLLANTSSGRFLHRPVAGFADFSRDYTHGRGVNRGAPGF